MSPTDLAQIGVLLEEVVRRVLREEGLLTGGSGRTIAAPPSAHQQTIKRMADHEAKLMEKRAKRAAKQSL